MDVVQIFKLGSFYSNIEIFEKLCEEGRNEEIKMIGKIENNEVDNYHHFLKYAIVSKDFEYLKYLTGEKFIDQKIIIGFLPEFDLEIAKILLYPNDQITQKTTRTFGNFLLNNCDFFDQFLSYNPKMEYLGEMIVRARKINLDNWYKICNNYSECFNFIRNHTLELDNMDELIQPLICAGFGKKIKPEYLSDELVFNNWFYLDLDKYFGRKDDFYMVNIYLKKPEIVFKICSNIISQSNNKKNCFHLDHKRDLTDIFRLMSKTNKAIFRKLIIESNFKHHKEYLLSKVDFYI